jgi:6-phosphogluconate dehydrogenase (decarboxylating)
MHPKIKGLAEAGFDKQDTVLLTERSSRLALIVGGHMGCEMAQAFEDGYLHCKQIGAGHLVTMGLIKE